MGLYLIEILHQTTTETPRNSQCWRCILSKFYIKPQLLASKVDNNRGCILSKFYIKPQLVAMPLLLNMVVSYRNSTSNHNNVSGGTERTWVVSYRNSTSNHNKLGLLLTHKYVVSYRNSTSNHNCCMNWFWKWMLYLIEILHQTTTCNPFYIRWIKLYLIEILHQTTTVTPIYIIPGGLYLIEILHQTTTERPVIRIY